MNIGEMKSFLKGASMFDVNRPKTGQADVANIKPNHGRNISASSIVQHRQSALLGFNVLNKVMAGKLQQLDPQTPIKPPQASEAEEAEDKPLFDFAEVAKNVLSFVEKALMRAKGNGADDDKLMTMMEKARKGVDDGFSQAREELEGMGQLNDEVEDGIGKSYDAIQSGLQKLEKTLFGETPEVQMMAAASEVKYASDKSSALSITTNDGDKVTINFAEAMRYQRTESAGAFSTTNDDGSTTNVSYSQSSETRFHAVGFSFSVEGELDDDEKAAIGALVQDVSKLADEFFNGDLDKAFEQAGQLGFDDEELSGFALNMSRTESFSVAQAYQQVAQYEPHGKPPKGPKGNEGQSEEAQNKPNLGQLMKPVANYLKELVAFLEKAREKLQDGNDLQSLVSESVNKYLDYRGEKEIPSALERFAEFNQRLLAGLEPDKAEKPAGSSDQSNATNEA